jgi:hypothetical protein
VYDLVGKDATPDMSHAFTTSKKKKKVVLSLLFQPSCCTRQEEQESFIGMSIPGNVHVHPPRDIRSKGKCKRILGHAGKYRKKHSSGPRKCTACKNLGHDRRNCPNKGITTS